ncbi:MAG TPA: transposase [Micromonosporaceae bacterium]|nr:transposase [Micromonosporaceae bacterium]HCU51195.1 transposase [Micromonosporaceae bacterium]
MRRSYKFRLRPTVKQVQALTAMLADHRDLYNAALQERCDAYRKRGVTISYGQQSGQLKDIRRELTEQARWSFSSQQATLRRLNLAMQAFFRRARAGQRPGYPRFKGQGWFDTVIWPSDGDGCRWDSTSDKIATRVYLQGAGHVRVQQHRPIQGAVKTISLKREGAAWYVILSCDDVPDQPLAPTGQQTGLDVGVNEFAALSDGTLIPNPRWAMAGADQLAGVQRRHSARYPKHAPRSKRKIRSAQLIAKIHRKIGRKRADFHHKQALQLVQRFDLIAHEQLNIAGMTRSPKPRADPGQPGSFLANGSTAKAGLNKSILDAGWGQFLTILAAKAECAGRLVIAVNPRYSSQTCFECAHIDAANRNGTEFRCVRCGHEDHADINAARNLLRAGLALAQDEKLVGSRSH